MSALPFYTGREASIDVIHQGTAMKCCRRCGRLKPADSQHFAPQKNVRRPRVSAGLTSRCRDCLRQAARERMAARRRDPSTAEKVREEKLRHARSEKGRAARRRRTQSDNQIRRQRQTGRPYEWGAQEWAACLDRWGHACAYCDAEGKLEQDHFIPISSPAFPGTVPANMVPACEFCNGSKGARKPFYWMKDRDRLRLVLERLIELTSQASEAEYAADLSAMLRRLWCPPGLFA